MLKSRTNKKFHGEPVNGPLRLEPAATKLTTACAASTGVPDARSLTCLCVVTRASCIAVLQFLCTFFSWVAGQCKRVPPKYRVATALATFSTFCGIIFLCVYFAMYWPLLSMRWDFYQQCSISGTNLTGLVTGSVTQYVLWFTSPHSTLRRPGACYVPSTTTAPLWSSLLLLFIVADASQTTARAVLSRTTVQLSCLW